LSISWSSVDILYYSLLTRLQQGVHLLTDFWLSLVLHKWLERPGHLRLVLNGELEAQGGSLLDFKVQGVLRDEHGNVLLVLLVGFFVVVLISLMGRVSSGSSLDFFGYLSDKVLLTCCGD